VSLVIFIAFLLGVNRINGLIDRRANDIVLITFRSHEALGAIESWISSGLSSAGGKSNVLSNINS
jgi:hypothetical protein